MTKSARCSVQRQSTANIRHT